MLRSPDENTQILDGVKDFYSLQDKILTSSATATSNPTKKVEYEYTTGDLYSKTVVERPVADHCKVHKGDKVTMLSNGEVMSGWENESTMNILGNNPPTYSPFYIVFFDKNRFVIGDALKFWIGTIDRNGESLTYSEQKNTGLTGLVNALACKVNNGTIFLAAENKAMLINIDGNDNISLGAVVTSNHFAPNYYDEIKVTTDGKKIIFVSYKIFTDFEHTNACKMYIVQVDIANDYTFTETITQFSEYAKIGNNKPIFSWDFYEDDKLYIAFCPYGETYTRQVTLSFDSNNALIYGDFYNIVAINPYWVIAVRLSNTEILLGYAKNSDLTHYYLATVSINSGVITYNTEHSYSCQSSTYYAYMAIFAWSATRIGTYHNLFVAPAYNGNVLTKYDISSGAITVDTVDYLTNMSKPIYLQIGDKAEINNATESAICFMGYGDATEYKLDLNIAFDNQANNIIGSARNTADGDLDETCEIIIDGLDDTNSGLIVNTDYYVNRDGTVTTDDTDGVYFGRAVSSTKIAFQSRMKTNTLDIRTEETVAAETDETKFSHKLPIKINGTQYYIMLTQT